MAACLFSWTDVKNACIPGVATSNKRSLFTLSLTSIPFELGILPFGQSGKKSCEKQLPGEMAAASSPNANLRIKGLNIFRCESLNLILAVQSPRPFWRSWNITTVTQVPLSPQKILKFIYKTQIRASTSKSSTQLTLFVMRIS